MAANITRAPGQRRVPKWAWIVGIVLLALALLAIVPRLIVRYQISAELKAFKAEGYPTTLDELDAWYPQPKGANAADVLNAAFAAYRSQSFKGVQIVSGSTEPKLPALGEPLPADMKAKIAACLADNAQALELLHKGAAIPECRFPIKMQQGQAITLNHLSNVRQGVRLLALEAIAKADDNKLDEAVDSLQAMVGMSRSLRDEPMLMSQMVRGTSYYFLSRGTERLLSRTSLPDAPLQHLAALVATESAEQQSSVALTRAVAAEVCLGNAMFEDRKSLRAALSGMGRATSFVVGGYRLSGLLRREQLAYVRWGRANLAMARLQTSQRIADAQAAQDQLEEDVRGRTFIYRFLPSLFGQVAPCFSNVFIVHAEGLARLRAMQTALAVERFRLAQGRLPDNLDDLVPQFLTQVPADPFDDRPLRYRRSEKGYVVYSVGLNRKDDGGEDGEGKWGIGDEALRVNR